MNRTLLLGALFLVGLIILAISTLVVGRISFGATYPLTVQFEALPGVKPGDEVWVDGVVAGRVARIANLKPTGVRVTLNMNEPIELYQDYQIIMKERSILGGGVIDIHPGKQSPAVDVRQVLVGKAERSGLQEIGQVVKDLTLDLKEGKGLLGKLIYDEKFSQDVTSTFTSLGAIAKKLESNEGLLGKLMNDKEFADNVGVAFTSLGKIAKQLESKEGLLGQLLYDKEFADNVRAAFTSLGKLTKDMEQGKGLLGKLATDEGLYKDLKETAEGAHKIIGKIAGTKVYLGGAYETFTGTQMSEGRVFLRIEPSDDKYFLVGVDVLNLDHRGKIDFENKLTKDENQTFLEPEIQLAYRVPWILDRQLTGRVGLIEGKPGAGLDLRLDNVLHYPVQLTFEGRVPYNDVDNEKIDEKINGPLLRTYLKTSLWREGFLSQIKVFGGINRIGSGPEFMGGVGFEYEDEDLRTLIGLLGLAR